MDLLTLRLLLWFVHKALLAFRDAMLQAFAEFGGNLASALADYIARGLITLMIVAGLLLVGAVVLVRCIMSNPQQDQAADQPPRG